VGRPQNEVDPFRDEFQALRKALGARIRHLRKLRSWSQEEFAAMAHVHRTFAGSLERGEKNCSFHALALISQCFGITIAGLLAGIEDGATQPASSPKGATRSNPAGADRNALNQRGVLQELATLERSVKSLKKLMEPTLVPLQERGTRKRARSG
jgi:transcriptional regulator with XRE-family HTH domain